MTPVTQKPRVNPDPCHTLWATMWSQLCCRPWATMWSQSLWCGHATGRCCVSCHCHPAACCTAMTALPPVMSQGAATCRVITVVLLPMGHCMVTVAAAWSCVTIPAVTPTFSSSSRPTASPEVSRDTSSGHVPLGSHVIHPRAPSSRPMPRDPVSHPRWARLRESPPSTPDAPDEPESSTDPRIDSAAMTKDLSILQGLLSRLPMSLWSAVPDMTDGH